MKIGIIGGGSIGLLMASLLVSNEQEVTLYTRRSTQKKIINEQGLTLYPSGERSQVCAALLSEIKREDLFLVCVKQYQLEEVLPYLVDIQAPLLFLQNGMGHINQFGKLSTSRAVITGVVEHGAMRIDDHTVQHTGEGKVKLALWRGPEELSCRLVTELNSESFPVEIAGNWFSLLTDKLIINAVINPLTAIFQVKNGMIPKNSYMVNLARQLCEEASQVLRLDAERQWQRVLNICEQTKENESSMLRDIKHRNQTEIEGISGYLLAESAQDLAATSFVYRSVKALELLGKGVEDD